MWCATGTQFLVIMVVTFLVGFIFTMGVMCYFLKSMAGDESCSMKR